MNTVLVFGNLLDIFFFFLILCEHKVLTQVLIRINIYIYYILLANKVTFQ